MALTTTRSAASGPPYHEISFFPLLRLPRDELALVIANVDRDKRPSLRLACAQLRDTVDAAVTALRGHIEDQPGLIFTSQLIMRLSRLTKVDIRGCREIQDLSPLAACVALQHLDCSWTAVSSLAPSASNTSLHTLDCSHTAVSSLPPLAMCESLRVLDCSFTAVSSLAPLATCTSLHVLNCSSTDVSSLEPLSSCTSLHTLSCWNTAVRSLDPLAACTSLKSLTCNSSLTIDFDFLKNAKIAIVGAFCIVHFPI